ncbi:MAG: hypothetical protein HRJ53_16685 [Acidobacteria bacterium Pan2503]|uniref:Uncharacterized protein n=1 Tax=Candidatus Acidiferrum panamense TaxID=2741543 RepID=A0A7V8NSA8_9BACT|nr:hypothetical protein [Candidatus Acidoferrum panamensis]
MKIAEEHIVALEALGYTELESRFLYIVATHSGYFVPRQFAEFNGASPEKGSQRFTEKLKKRGHGTWREYQNLGGVYHLSSRTVYRLTDRDRLSHRQPHSTEFIRTRLLLLDFIFANHTHDYLETEQDKVRFFSDNLGIPRKLLPARAFEVPSAREPVLGYFADKFPLYLDSSAGSSSPVLTFSYVDAGQARRERFAHHLNAYASLFRHLRSFCFVYIADSPLRFPSAQERFSLLVQTPLEEVLLDELERYFKLRAAWEGKQYGKLSMDDLEWLDQANQRFTNREIERLYDAWDGSGAGRERWRRLFSEVYPPRAVEFRTCLLTPSGSKNPKAAQEGTGEPSAPSEEVVS